MIERTIPTGQTTALSRHRGCGPQRRDAAGNPMRARARRSWMHPHARDPARRVASPHVREPLWVIYPLHVPAGRWAVSAAVCASLRIPCDRVVCACRRSRVPRVTESDPRLMVEWRPRCACGFERRGSTCRGTAIAGIWGGTCWTQCAHSPVCTDRCALGCVLFHACQLPRAVTTLQYISYSIRISSTDYCTVHCISLYR